MILRLAIVVLVLSHCILFTHAQLLEALPRHAYWGASLDPPTETAAGASVHALVEKGFAEQIGLIKGDVVLRVNGIFIRTNSDYQRIFWSAEMIKGGSKVTLEILRAGKLLTKSGIVPPKPLESFPGIVTEYKSVMSPYGYKVQVIVTRPQQTKGKIPGIFLVRWMSCDPIEKPVSRKHGVARILEDFILKSGYAVMRVEKPGLGDSEGPSCYDCDFQQELAAHQAAYKAFRELDFVDASKIIVFAQSNGMAYAPRVVGDFPPAGYAVSGGWTKTWFEHELEFRRSLFEMEGNSVTEINRKIRLVSEFYTDYLIYKMIPGEILSRKPHLKEIWDGEYDHQHELPISYLQQLQELNVLEAWSKVNVPVYSFFGEYDFAMKADDHQQLAELVNKQNPGKSKFEIIPQMNHSFFWFKSKQAGFDDFYGNGVYRSELGEKLIAWMHEILK